ncbi:hypothetical protein [Lysobacter enzymogenes]|uniref:hypothetical protein n=1 Tax=Lysobacter enzymogenes TaxID=69 RepID=UPI000896F03A|nr:hypothetical protein [Lysobacter enzymogenes]SDW94133.1 hypothetical protein SAMN05421681_103288 [Lysobacter enzymogenes]
MAAFFVGQRVRIKNAERDARRFIGSECRIVGQEQFVEADYWVTDLIDPTDGLAWMQDKRNASDVFEPILPEGMQPARWEDCAWKPQGQEVTA